MQREDYYLVVMINATLNVIEYVTTASSADAQDFGDLTGNKVVMVCFSPTRAW